MQGPLLQQQSDIMTLQSFHFIPISLLFKRAVRSSYNSWKPRSPPSLSHSQSALRWLKYFCNSQSQRDRFPRRVCLYRGSSQRKTSRTVQRSNEKQKLSTASTLAPSLENDVSVHSCHRDRHASRLQMKTTRKNSGHPLRENTTYPNSRFISTKGHEFID